MTRGTDFLSAITAEYESIDDPVTSALLNQLVTILDEQEGMEKAVKRDGYMIEGARGQRIANPLLSALQKNRETFDRLSSRLFPGENQETTSQQASRAARARWAKAKEPR